MASSKNEGRILYFVLHFILGFPRTHERFRIYAVSLLVLVQT